VSLRGYYHRAEFRHAATQLGLQVHFLNRRYGFCVTTWPASGVPEKYRGVLETLSQFAVVASNQLPRHAAPPPAKKQVPWVVLRCACAPVRITRAQPEELHRGEIVCAACGERFPPEGGAER
jgi:hypothetical protein